MKNGPYELIIAPENYPGKRYRNKYAYEHIVRFWEHNGIVPPKGYEIHHKNMNHRDNRIENLELISMHEHRVFHGKLSNSKNKLPLVKLNCTHCKIVFEKSGRIIKTRKKNAKLGKLYCSHKCQHDSMRGGRKDRRLAVN